MAVITPTSIVKNVASADLPITAGTAIVAANTDTIAYPKEGRLLIVINNTTETEQDITFSAGDKLSAGQGDLVVEMATLDVRFVVLESSRFSSSDQITIDYEAGTTGFVMAFYIP